MEIKTVASTKLSPSPTFGFKCTMNDKRNTLFSPSESMIQIWKSQRSKSKQEGEILLRSKKEPQTNGRKMIHRDREGLNKDGEQFSSTKSSLTQGSRDNSLRANKNRQREFNERLKRAMMNSDGSAKKVMQNERLNDKSPLKLAGTSKILYKVFGISL